MSKEKVKNSPAQIILLAVPPYLLTFLEEEGGEGKVNEKNCFFSLASIANLKNELEIQKNQKKTADIISLVKNLSKADLSLKILKILENEKKKIVLINYPLGKENLQSLEKELAKNGHIIKTFIFVFFQGTAHFEKITAELKNKTLLCPVCERAYKREGTIKENDFLCPNDGTKFSQAEVEEFTKFYNDYYFTKITELIEYQKQIKRKIIPLELLMKEDFSPANLHKYLQEKIDSL